MEEFMAVTLTLVGSREIIDKLSTEDKPDDVEMDEPQLEGGLADAVDSPIGPQEIEAIMQLLTVAIGTVTSAVVLFEKIKRLVSPTGATVQVRDTDNRSIGKIDVSTDVRQLAKSLFE
jgi:hypothetical protein